MAEQTAEELAAAEAARLAAEAEAKAGGKTPEQIAAAAAEAETARLAAEAEAARVAAAGAKTPEQLEVERLAEEAKKAKPKVDWRDARIAELTAKLKSAVPAKIDPPALDPNATPLTEADVERRATEKATGLAARAAFNQRCNDTAAEGRKAFPDFDLSVRELMRLSDPQDPAVMRQYDDFLEAAMETGEGPRIIYNLGKDLDEAARVMGLSPIKRAAEMAALAAGAAPAAPLHKPIVPVRGGNSGPGEISPDDAARADKLSSAEWHRRRSAQVAANQPAFGRRQQ